MEKKMNEVARKLESAIAAYDGDTGPVIWTVSERGEDSASLVATYSEDIVLEDEPWTQFGGDAILQAAGFDSWDSGMDNYQDRHGTKLVCQWAVCSA